MQPQIQNNPYLPQNLILPSQQEMPSIMPNYMYPPPPPPPPPPSQEISKQNSNHSKKGKNPMISTNSYCIPGQRQLSLQHNVQPLSERASMSEKSQQNQDKNHISPSHLSSISKNKNKMPENDIIEFPTEYDFIPSAPAISEIISNKQNQLF